MQQVKEALDKDSRKRQSGNKELTFTSVPPSPFHCRERFVFLLSCYAQGGFLTSDSQSSSVGVNDPDSHGAFYKDGRPFNISGRSIFIQQRLALEVRGRSDISVRYLSLYEDLRALT